MTELQLLAQKKYNQIAQGNGSENRMLKLYNIHTLLSKESLTEQDVDQLQHFVMATRTELDRTAYVANTVISPMSWGHVTQVIKRKE